MSCSRSMAARRVFERFQRACFQCIGSKIPVRWLLSCEQKGVYKKVFLCLAGVFTGHVVRPGRAGA